MDDPLDAIYWRDEILQILYWFRGEGLGEAVTPRDLVIFLETGEEVVQQHLERLADQGYVTRHTQEVPGVPTRYRLTEWGVKEGGRRFADEFAELTRQAHGTCNNPNCSCQTLGPGACEARTHEHI